MRKPVTTGEYARALSKAMRVTIDPATDEPIRLRGLERMLAESGHRYSYEHLRKTLAGEPVVSEELNEQLCIILRLDTDKMWQTVLGEKAIRRFGGFTVKSVQPPENSRFRTIWPKLKDDQQDKLLTIAEGWAVENEVERPGRR